MKQRFAGESIPTKEKNMSSDLPIKTATATGEMVFPMGQHIGAPATPIVAKGDKGISWTKNWRSQWFYFCKYLQLGFWNS